MNLASLLANKCFEFLLSCDGEKGAGQRLRTGRQAESSVPAHRPLPPWALAEQDFRAQCDGCRVCMESCENTLLVADAAGCPVVDFSRGACTFCGACAQSCPHELFRPCQSEPAWDIKALVTAACLARNNVVCRTCAEHCPEAAIIFPVQSGSLGTPQVLAQRCTGCGACFGPCPSGAIVMSREEDKLNHGGNR